MTDTIEDVLRQLRYLTQALLLIADATEEKHESEAIIGIAVEMRARIESVEEKLFQKPKLAEAS